MRQTGHLVLWSMDCRRQARQKVWPHEVVTGSNSSSVHTVHSSSSRTSRSPAGVDTEDTASARSFRCFFVVMVSSSSLSAAGLPPSFLSDGGGSTAIGATPSVSGMFVSFVVLSLRTCAAARWWFCRCCCCCALWTRRACVSHLTGLINTVKNDVASVFCAFLLFPVTQFVRPEDDRPTTIVAPQPTPK